MYNKYMAQYPYYIYDLMQENYFNNNYYHTIYKKKESSHGNTIRNKRKD